MADIVRITDTFERQRALMDLVDSLGPAEFAGVAEQFRELDHLDNSRGEYDLILRGWAKADPLAALEYVEQHPNSQAGRSTVLSTWAGNDAAAAERWALDHHEGDGPNPHLASVIRGIAGNDLATASRLAESMPAEPRAGRSGRLHHPRAFPPRDTMPPWRFPTPSQTPCSAEDSSPPSPAG